MVGVGSTGSEWLVGVSQGLRNKVWSGFCGTGWSEQCGVRCLHGPGLRVQVDPTGSGGWLSHACSWSGICTAPELWEEAREALLDPQLSRGRVALFQAASVECSPSHRVSPCWGSAGECL